MLPDSHKTQVLLSRDFEIKETSYIRPCGQRDIPEMTGLKFEKT